MYLLPHFETPPLYTVYIYIYIYICSDVGDMLFYSVITFLLSLSAHSVLTEIKTFTSINLEQSLLLCKV